MKLYIKNKKDDNIHYHPFYMDCTCRKSNFLKYIKELIEELKRSETVLFLEHYNFFKQTYITLKNNNCHSELVYAN